MKVFLGSLAFLFVITILFFWGATTEFSWMLIFLCPSGLIALWVNGFAASRMNVRITVEDKTPARHNPNRIAKSASEYQ